MVTDMEKGTQTKKQIELPSRWQLIVLLPFAALYMFFIILGNLEKAEGLGAARNIGRILLWLFIRDRKSVV